MPVVNNIIIVDPMIISRAQSSFNLIIYQICDQCLGPEDQFFLLNNTIFFVKMKALL